MRFTIEHVDDLEDRQRRMAQSAYYEEMWIARFVENLGMLAPVRAIIHRDKDGKYRITNFVFQKEHPLKINIPGLEQATLDILLHNFLEHLDAYGVAPQEMDV
jgi:hypothetical protein